MWCTTIGMYLNLSCLTFSSILSQIKKPFTKFLFVFYLGGGGIE